ncbi:hypothetical protein [Modestobacter italicus]|uniref:hypothetical protein n=1 Tax=Modestobacter italicus (strain DSM 44449 / CECT 9708 / BC 501) TaxID=2732864 RepID=UPI001C9454E6|nr:hypothetical protein [Modestobacter italicus]
MTAWRAVGAAVVPQGARCHRFRSARVLPVRPRLPLPPTPRSPAARLPAAPRWGGPPWGGPP